MHSYIGQRSDGPGFPADWRRKIEVAVTELLTEAVANPAGTMSPSVYETARLVRTAPWLDGHSARCDFLLRTQRPDGWWGQPDGYDLVPTLSATEALLHELDQPAVDSGRPPTARIARAALQGLWALSDRLRADRLAAMPDTIAAELIVPWLIDELNDRLATTGGRLGATEVHVPDGVDRQPLERLRAAAAGERPLPEKLWHALEVLGDQSPMAPGVRPVSGAVGSSPAATAAWLTGRPMPKDLVAALTRTQERWGGPVPGVISIAVFERAWVLGWLLDAGVAPVIPEELTAYLENSLDGSGAPAGPGLPSDSDDTAAVLHALALAKRPVATSALWTYEADDYFLCFPGERTPSTSTNAHVLEALPATPNNEGVRHDAAVRKIQDWLLAMQHPDGSWDDKWHASPYYATMCCAVALARGHRPATAQVVARAARWTLETQRADGSWGRWTGTTEETSYAVQTLLRAHPGDLPAEVSRAVADGCAHLLADQGDDFPPLWHDKDLYAPITVVKAARLAALHAAATRLAPTGTAAGHAFVR